MTEQPSSKVSLWQMILFVEQEIERCNTWERVLHSEGEALDPSIAARRTYFKKINQTLRLLEQHEQTFVQMVTASREAAKRRASGGGSPRSTEASSDPSTSES